MDLDESSLVGTVTNWSQFLGRAWNSGAPPVDSIPRFYKYTFNYTSNPAIHQTFRLTCSSLSRGAAWINGHSLGRTRTNMPNYAPLYVPECWLQATNTLIIFSEDGVAPGGPALTPQETYSVQQISSVSVRPESQRPSPVLPHNVTANVLRTVYDLLGRVIARIPAGKNLAAPLQMQSRRGVYIVRTGRQSQSLGRAVIRHDQQVIELLLVRNVCLLFRGLPFPAGQSPELDIIFPRPNPSLTIISTTISPRHGQIMG